MRRGWAAEKARRESVETGRKRSLRDQPSAYHYELAEAAAGVSDKNTITDRCNLSSRAQTIGNGCQVTWSAREGSQRDIGLSRQTTPDHPRRYDVFKTTDNDQLHEMSFEC